MRLTPEEQEQCFADFHTYHEFDFFESPIDVQSILGYKDGVLLFWRSSETKLKTVYAMSYDKGKLIVGYFNSTGKFYKC